MKRIILLVCTTVVLFSCDYNNNNNNKLTVNQDSLQYIQNAVAFIKEVKKYRLSTPYFALVDKPYSSIISSSDCLERVLEDTAFFTKEELTYIKEQRYPTISKWSNELFPEITIINSDTLDFYFKDFNKGWEYVQENYKDGFSSFSSPIFLRNNTYCLFYSDDRFGNVGGEGHLELYKREYNSWWIKVKTYCGWIA